MAPRGKDPKGAKALILYQHYPLAVDIKSMPIGVPTVSWREPGTPAEQARYIDIYNRLHRARVLLLGSDLDDELANQLVGCLIYNTSEDPKKRNFLYINSPGGAIGCGLMLADIVNYVSCGVTTVCAGTAASMASYVLCNGNRGYRYSLPNSFTMIHQPSGGSAGQGADLEKEAQHVERMRDRVIGTYAAITGQSREIITLDMDRDKYLDADQTKEFGLTDAVTVTIPRANPPRG